MEYRRAKVPGTRYFFTITLTNRKSTLLIDEIKTLKIAFQKVKVNHPFKIDGVVILPNHLHMMMTLPHGDSNYSQRLNLIKGTFSRQINRGEAISMSRKRKRERGIWQRRFWEHLIRDDQDFERHMDYIHYNPVKHGYVSNPSDWRFSSIHRYIADGTLPLDWGGEINFTKKNFGE